VGAVAKIWFLLPKRLADGQYLRAVGHDGLLFSSGIQFLTGGNRGHEMLVTGPIVGPSTPRFLVPCTLDPEYSLSTAVESPRSSAELATGETRLPPQRVAHRKRSSTLRPWSQTNTQGWRPTKAESGCRDRHCDDQIVATGFAMPHSPRVHNDCLFCLNSGHGNRWKTIDRETGKSEAIEIRPGYAERPRISDGWDRLRSVGNVANPRDLCLRGIPIAEKRDELRCGRRPVIDLRTGNSIAYLEFLSACKEIFDVQIASGLANHRSCQALTPAIDRDGKPLVVVTPMSSKVDRSGSRQDFRFPGPDRTLGEFRYVSSLFKHGDRRVVLFPFLPRGNTVNFGGL